MNKSALIALVIIILAPGCAKKPYESVIKTKKEKTFKDKMAIVKEQYVLTATKKHKRPKDLTLAEAVEDLAFFEETEQYDRMTRVLQRILALETDQQKVGNYMLKLAKLQTSLGRLDEAQATYHSFRSLYPGHPKIKKALYRELLTHFWDILPPDRDQSRTENTVKLAQNYLEEFPEDTLYKDSVNTTLKICQKNLFEGEIVRARHYLAKNKYEPSEDTVMAAYQRLAYAEKELLPKIAPSDTVLAQLHQEFNTITEQHEKALEDEQDLKEAIGKKGHLVLAENLEAISDKLLGVVQDTPIVATNTLPRLL